MIEIDRKILLNVFSYLISVDFDDRNERWEEITSQVKKILNKTREDKHEV